jgi:Na+-translocating ferredoxin:NAD+ oxidoreductase RnfD subunit
MKPITVCLACSFLLLQPVKAQDSLKYEQIQTHQALLARITFSETQSMKVHIMNIKDSAVFVYQKASGKPDPFHTTNIYNESSWDSYNYRFIQSVKVRNKKIRSWLLPVSIVGGIVAGALIGYAASKNNGGIEDELNQAGGIVLGGFLGGGLGTLTGLIICNASDKKYMINGDWKSFEEMKRSLNY